MRMHSAVVLLCVLCTAFFSTGALSAFVKDPTLCSRSSCSATSDLYQKFKYQKDVTYRYQYSIDVSTSLGEPVEPGKARNESTLHIDSVVSLRFASPCEGYLQFSDASISQDRSRYDPEYPDKAGAEFQKSLEKYELRFSFHDGHVEEVCPHPGDAVWVLNLKKGVLSMFQNRMRRFDVDHKVNELDVNGICETQYKLHEARRTSLIITKTKNIPTCTNRYKLLSVIQSTSYRSPLSLAQPIAQPLLKSWNKCEITIDHNIYQSVTCAESHLLRPFSNGDQAGMRTDTNATLKLLEENADFYVPDIDDEPQQNAKPEKRTNLLYDHERTPKPTHGELRTSRDLMKHMCNMGGGEQVQQQFSEMFTKFIHSARLLKYSTLLAFFTRANAICRTGRKHMIDALPFIGSNASVKLMKDLIIKKSVSQETVDQWVTAFGLIPHPDRGTISALAPLLDHQQEIPEAQFILAYSAVIHAYCARGESDCLQLEPVARFLEFLELKVQKGCARHNQSPSAIQETLEALKAIGNLGVETTTLVKKLRDCIDGGGGYLPMELRVAAVDAHRRLPSCKETRDDYLLNLYRNDTQDTELRIASYLQVMRCPNYHVVKVIKHTLKLEEVNQVGSYVWSHLTNMLSSSSPTRIEVQSLLTDRDLSNKFNSDIRKFSRNYDKSFFSEEYNFGANYQSDVIFSPKSYIPRTTMFNVTVDLFGESINLFELGIRMEGMEFYAENLFGPDGPFSSDKVSNEVTNQIRKLLRRFRSAPEEGDDYHKQVKRLPNVIDNNFDNPKISIGYKVFGNDLKYVTLSGHENIKAKLMLLDPWAKVKQILSGKQLTYENTAMFLDSTYVVPMTSGLPIRLGAFGSAACNFKMSGFLNSANFVSNGEMEVRGNIMPSVSVDVTGSMIVDGFYKSAGIKLSTNLYSSGALQVHLNIKGTQLVSLSLGLPNQKMEVFSVLTNVFLINTNGPNVDEKAVGVLLTVRDLDKRKPHPRGNTIGDTTCSWPSLDRLIGLKLCTDYQFENVTKNPNASYFILNGPTLFKISVIKADPTAKNYLFEYKWLKTANESIIRLAFDTPGSKIKRELSATVSLDVNSQNVTLILQSNGSTLTATGTYKRTENEALMDLALDIDGTKHLDASVGYRREIKTYRKIYYPRIYLAINTERILELSGHIQIAEKKNVSHSEIDMTFETKKLWSKVVGYMTRTEKRLSGNVKLEYQLGLTGTSVKPKKETLKMDLSLADRSYKNHAYEAANMTLISSAYPQLDMEIVSWYRLAVGHLELHGEVNSSPHLQDDRHKFTAQLIMTHSQNNSRNATAKVSASLTLTKPIQNLDIKLGIDRHSSRDKTMTKVLVRYAPGKEIVLAVNVVMPQGPSFSLGGYVNLTIPNFNSMLIAARINQTTRNEYNLDFAGTWFSGHNITARGTYTDHSTAAIIDLALKLLLKSPSFAKDIILNCNLHHDASELDVGIQVEHLDSDKYAFSLNHTILTFSRFVTHVELRFKDNVYSVMTRLYKGSEVSIEMHLDKLRDIHLMAKGVNEPGKREAALELKWDANRDPALKLATSVGLYSATTTVDNLLSSRNVSAITVLTYPGRLITGSCSFSVLGYSNYETDVRLDWSPSSTVHFMMNTDYSLQPQRTSMKIESQLLTPFDKWKRTSLSARYLQSDTSITASSSAHWQDYEHVIIKFSGNLKKTKDSFVWDGGCVLQSTVHAIKSIIGNLTHKQIHGESMDSHLSVKYHPDKVIDVKSFWQLDKEADNKFNISGILNLESPLANYKRGEMKCQLRVMPNWQIYGGANMNVDKRKYTGQLRGDLAKLKESMLQFNVTTPLEKYSFIRGRFGFSESNKHIVAEVVSPSGPIGMEAMCQLFTKGSNFHVKLLLATPIDVLQKSLLVAKLTEQEADFRVAYNNLTAGFQGVWHYHNITDFHYSYILYTPFEGFQECGVVTKLVVVEKPPTQRLDVDAELSVRLSETKLGVRAKGGPKPPPVRIAVRAQTDGIDEDEDEDDDYEENLFWRGELEVDVAIIDTIQGAIDIDEEDSTHKILGSLKLPSGVILIDDRFFMEDVFHIVNDLSIETPFSCASEITSNYVFTLDMGNSIITGMNLKIKKQSTWIEGALLANYSYQVGETADSKTYIVNLHLKTPINSLKNVNFSTVVEIDENLYKTSTAIRAEKCQLDLDGSLEADDDYFDATVAVNINSFLINIPRTGITVRKDFTDKEKRAEFAINIQEPVPKTFKLVGSWQIEEKNFAKASINLETWNELLKSIQANVLYSNTFSKDGTGKLNLEFTHHPQQEYQFLGNLKDKVIIVDLHSPLEGNAHLQFTGTVDQKNDERITLEGFLKNVQSSDTYKVVGTLETNNIFSQLTTTITPTSPNLPNDQVTLKLRSEKYKIALQAQSKLLNGSVNLNCVNKFNWDARVLAKMQAEAANYQFTTSMNTQVNGNTTIYIHAESPHQVLERLTVNGNMLLANKGGDIRMNHQLNRDSSHLQLTWNLEYMENMAGKIVAGYQQGRARAKHIDSRVFFLNPGKSLRSVNAGFDVNVDHERWRFASNASLGCRDENNVDAILSLILPPPNNDQHKVLLSYHAEKNFSDASYVIGYNADKAKLNYASDGSLRFGEPDIDGHIRLTWGMHPSQTLNNLFNMSFKTKEIGVRYSLFSPKYIDEETLVLALIYDTSSGAYSILKTDVYSPARRRIGYSHISYASLSNVNGTVNATTPFDKLSYVGCNFEIYTISKQNKRYAEFFWPTTTAVVSSEYAYESERLDSSLDGALLLEIPLSTRHIGKLTYGYKKRPLITTGYSELIYNGKREVHVLYNEESESRAGLEKNHIEITVKNSFKPLGIIYDNQYEYSAGNEGTNYPTVKTKRVNLYRLDNRTAFDISGESRMKTTHTGQDIHLKASNSNRTIQLRVDYEILPGEFDQNTWLSLADDAWASYHINILNKTTKETDNQFVVIDLSYPRRNFTLDGSYKITSSELNSDARLKWNKVWEEPRSIGTAFQWKNLTSTDLTNQEAILTFHHPSFTKNATFTGRLVQRDPRDLLNAELVVDYSPDQEKLLLLSGILRDESNLPADRKYTYEILGKHQRTNLDLGVRGEIHKHLATVLEMTNHASYKRSFAPVESGQLSARFDLNRYEVELRRENNNHLKYFTSRYYPKHPVYVINGSLIVTPELNATGKFYIDIKEKLTWLMVNYTPDAVESLRMYGNIPDARSAVFNLWRTYDQELTISDIAFYLKLNHSRLVTSMLRWRPDLKEDVSNTISSTVNDMYEEMKTNTDNWKQYIRSETIDAINGVWEDAQEEVKEFVDDWNNLKELQTDLDDLKVYLNNSYNANEFYVKDIVAITMCIVDKLSLRSKIQSLPNIFNEIWEIMGESGEAIRQSLLWAIETIKKGYNKISEIISAMLNGDSMSQITTIVEKFVETYDKFIKDLHVSFIKYIGNLWNKISLALSQQWAKVLKLIEPMFIRVIHYLETVIWKASKEVLDFLYDRKNDLMNSPYFDRFTKFTQDIDKIYKDVQAHDIITNIRKYSALLIQFFKERYSTMVPFGQELKGVIDEIISEFMELKKLPSVQYSIEKTQQLYNKAKYLYDYFDVESTIERAIRFIHSKLIDVSQTALQAENRYREAKTKFIFDPQQGLMCLEQKLPMSWHAFNQTPEFQEIPEYRAITDMQLYFATSNTTFWTLYYQYKPYTEPSNWLPPFKAQAMIAGSQHYKTFDGRYFEFSGSCTYLLAHDFVRNKFAVLVKYNANQDSATHQIIVLIEGKAIELDIFKDSVKLLGSGESLQLPADLGNGTAFIYQKESIVTVESKHEQFKLECNLKFDLCILELSGWFHGKTAGLLGTMSNEPMDDFLTSSGTVVKDLATFAQSWSLDRTSCTDNLNRAAPETTKEETSCNALFAEKNSEFISCFSIVNPDVYLGMCLRSKSREETCTVAVAYIQVCSFHYTYLRIPDTCTMCKLENGTKLPEGEPRTLKGRSVPRSSDVVFIVEAKACNEGVKENRSIEQLVSQLNKELHEQQLKGNRWSLVVFGGDGVYDEPRSLILDSKIFTTDAKQFPKYFENIPVGDGSQDIFGAIGYASKLTFRAGVSKTFILMPCSNCDPDYQLLDYSSLHHELLGHDIKLHILMDGEFNLEKERYTKTFYGLDATKAYTNKDARTLIGDVDVRRQVKLSKNILGYCIPLSLESNGSIFSGNHLQSNKLSSVKRFANVFSKRVALSAAPGQCQSCECNAHNDGVTQIECILCDYPTPAFVDDDIFEEDESLFQSQIPDYDYPPIDLEEE